MPQYLFVYHGGTTPTDPAEIEATMAAWGAWFQNMGPALEIPGNPVGQSHTVSADGVADNGGPNPASGFTVVKADSIDDEVARVVVGSTLELRACCLQIKMFLQTVAPSRNSLLSSPSEQ